MTYIIAQAFGICATVSCFLVPMFKKKWQIFTGAIFNNLFIGLNFILLGEMVSSIMSFVGIIQCLLVIFYVRKEKDVPKAIPVIFMILGLPITIMGFSGPLDLLPLVASVSYNLSVLMRKEQTVRKYLLVNAGAWVIYDAAIGATSLFGHIVGFASTALALFKYRNKEEIQA